MKELDTIKNSFLEDLKGVSSNDTLNSLRADYFGKNGKITSVMKLLKDMTPEEKKEFGVAVNSLKNEL